MRKFIALAIAVATLSVATDSFAHCQVPCGIYDDPARITGMREDASTITKAINNITELAGKADAQSVNQAVRWVTTKEAHASNIISVVSEYFLAQKLKPVAAGEEGHDAYLARLADHHAVMRAAMATKQKASLEAASALDAAIEKLAAHYHKAH
ncbi:MAG: superoxide dismutase [Gemmatimonadetes bacterium]|nr:superoxide dismutase [Gemmatimonadota bacterium]